MTEPLEPIGYGTELSRVSRPVPTWLSLLAMVAVAGGYVVAGSLAYKNIVRMSPMVSLMLMALGGAIAMLFVIKSIITWYCHRHATSLMLALVWIAVVAALVIELLGNFPILQFIHRRL